MALQQRQSCFIVAPAHDALANADCQCMCRSMSLTDLLDSESRPTGSPRVASNEAMAAAEAATASALHPGQHSDSTASTSALMDSSPAAEASPADDNLVPEAASFGSPFDSGLHEQAMLLHAAGDEGEAPAVDDGVQHLADAQVHLLYRLTVMRFCLHKIRVCQCYSVASRICSILQTELRPQLE